VEAGVRHGISWACGHSIRVGLRRNPDVPLVL
jgi:hypothetical protein